MTVARYPLARSNTRKVYFAGTHRVQHPEHTWAVVAPKLPRFGITRVADVTGLDILGVPVAMAVRPLAKTLSVSQGKGCSYQLARISAAMEAIEIWHAEHVVPRVAHRRVPAHELALPYRFEHLVGKGGLVGDTAPLDWVDAAGLHTGSSVPVPLRTVSYARISGASWFPLGLRWNTNGLASGNSRPEAALHALYEVIERDAIRAVVVNGLRVLDPRSVDDAGCARLIDQIRSGGAWLEAYHLPSRLGVPCFGAKVWSADFPVVSRGWGAHSAVEVALSRAITEAAQSRLTAIVGSRDDLPSIYAHVRGGSRVPLQSTEMLRWQDVEADPVREFDDVADELRWMSGEVTRVVGCEPLLVDLSTDDEFAVVRVIVPGAELDMDLIHPRR